jgi:hypothetical protein
MHTHWSSICPLTPLKKVPMPLMSSRNPKTPPRIEMPRSMEKNPIVPLASIISNPPITWSVRLNLSGS